MRSFYYNKNKVYSIEVEECDDNVFKVTENTGDEEVEFSGVPADYLLNEVVDGMKKNNVPLNVINTFKTLFQ